MSVWLDDYKRLHQIVFGVPVQHSFEFAVDGVLSGGQYAEIQDSCAQRFDENEATEVSVACHKYPALFLSRFEQVFVACL